MKLEVSKCYVLTSDGKQKKFRVVKYDSSGGTIIIRDCKTKQEEDFIGDTNKGGFSGDFTLEEFNCIDCDGKE